MGHGEALGGVVADQALALGGRQGGAQRDHGVGDGAVAKALALLLLVGQPVHKAGQRIGAHVGQLQLAREVAVRVGADQAAVFFAGAFAEAAPSLAAVALDPFIDVTEEADRRALLQLAAVPVGFALALDPPRRLIGAGTALALPAGAAEDADVADHVALSAEPLEDARGLGLDEPPLVTAAWTGRRSRRILGNAHEHHLVSRGRIVSATPPRFDVDGQNITRCKRAEWQRGARWSSIGEGQQSQARLTATGRCRALAAATGEDRYGSRPLRDIEVSDLGASKS
jgi:hypothetical protein